MQPSVYKAVFAALSIFENLRRDEIGRAARRFELREIPAGESLSIDESL
jgi:hypothetical protein